MKKLPKPKSVEIPAESLKEFKAHVRSYNTPADFIRANPQFDKATVSRIMNSRGKKTVSFENAEKVKSLVESLKAVA